MLEKQKNVISSSSLIKKDNTQNKNDHEFSRKNSEDA